MLEREGVTFQGFVYLPLKSGGFFGTFGCTGKGYVGRGEEGTFKGSLCSPLKSGVFFAFFGCVGWTGLWYIGRELLVLRSRERRALIQGWLCSPLKSGGFFGTFVCTGKEYVARKLLLLRSRERRALFRARFARLSKVVVFLALL